MGCGSCGKKYSQQKQLEKKAKVAAHTGNSIKPSSVPTEQRRFKITTPSPDIKKDA